jgi:HK97 family phage major capsid protein
LPLERASRAWACARWVFHRDAIKRITKLKDGEGQYLWSQSVRDGEPDRILGLGIATSEWAPNTFSTGEYVELLGVSVISVLTRSACRSNG